MLKGKELGAAIAAAIKLKRERFGTRKVDVARHFDVKPPTVQDWEKTGRIGKDKLPELVNYFSDVVSPEHWGLSDAMAAMLSETGDELARDGDEIRILKILRSVGDDEGARLRIIGAASDQAKKELSPSRSPPIDQDGKIENPVVIKQTQKTERKA